MEPHDTSNWSAFSRTDNNQPELNSKRELRARRRLLLVEDNHVNQDVAVAVLRKLGYSKIDVVSNGLEALTALGSTDYDLVLMDCQMPEMDGYEATRLIRQPTTQVLNHRVPVIAVTAHVLPGDREKCLQAGMNDYIPKPIEPALMERVLDTWTGVAHLLKRGGENKPAPSIPQTPHVFDSESLVRRMMDSTELASRVAATFLADMPRQMSALTRALDCADAKSVRMAAHSIKGAAAIVGGNQLRSIAADMERLAANGDVGSAALLLPEIGTLAETLRAEIEKFCATAN